MKAYFWKKYWVLCLLGIAWSGSLQATHIVGGDMYYVCTGPGKYAFEIIIYRECQSGSTFDGAPNISVFKASSPTAIQNLTASTPLISEVPINDIDPCLSIPPDICLQKLVSRFNLTLPLINRSYYVVHQSCCRNNGVSNLVDSGDEGSTYIVELNGSAQSKCNNSAVFENFPPPLLCANEPINFDHSAFDPDGDELVYELCTPLDDSFSQLNPFNAGPPPYDGVNFIPPYTALTPIIGDPAFAINSSTGLITGTPLNAGLYVVGVCVSEYRNGQFLGSTQRDFQFSITYCPPLVDAKLNGEAVDEYYVYETCGETTVNFINESTDVQYIQEYYWEFPIPGEPGPRIFSSKDVSLEFPAPGKYFGKMILNPGSECSDSTDIEINISPDFTPTFQTDYDTCVAGSVSFFDLTVENPGFEFVSRSWSFGDGDSSTLANPVHLYSAPGSYLVSLTLEDVIGCVETTSQIVDWFPVPATLIFEPSSFSGCPNEVFTFSTTPVPFDDSYSIYWDFGDGQIDSTLVTNHAYDEGGTYSIRIEVISSLGCVTVEEFPEWITIDSFPEANFSWTPQTGISNFEPLVYFQNESLRAEEFDWLFGENGIDFSSNPSFSFPDTGLQRVQLIASSANGCLDTLVKWVDVVPENTFHLPNAFSPNGDGLNETFKGVGLGPGFQTYHLRILNRWGQLVFESHDPEVGWNGRYQNTGKSAQIGVYTYYCQYREPRGDLHQLQGFTTLIR